MGILRARVHWSGFVGSPGLSTHYFAATLPDPTADLHTFYAAVATQLPTVVKIDIEQGGDVLDEVTGAVTSSWVGSASATIQGAVAGNYSGPTGGLVEWLTNTVVGRRRVRGKTFLVPIGGTLYDADGSLQPGAVTAFKNAAAALVASASGAAMKVWSRPRAATATVPGRPGSVAAVTGSKVPDLAVVLRSRRS